VLFRSVVNTIGDAQPLLGVADGSGTYGTASTSDDRPAIPPFRFKVPETPATQRRVLDGLVPGHAYTVLAVKEVTFRQSTATGERRVIRMVHLKNPHGSIHASPDQWVYDWSPHSTKWSRLDGELLRRKLGQYNIAEKLQEGELWIPFDAFVRYFSGLTICKVQIRGLNDPPDPAFVKHYGCSHSRGPRRLLKKAFILEVSSGFASIIVAAWSRHPAHRISLRLYSLDDLRGFTKRCLTAAVEQAPASSKGRPTVRTAVLTTDVDEVCDSLTLSPSPSLPPSHTSVLSPLPFRSLYHSMSNSWWVDG